MPVPVEMEIKPEVNEEELIPIDDQRRLLELSRDAGFDPVGHDKLAEIHEILARYRDKLSAGTSQEATLVGQDNKRAA